MYLNLPEWVGSVIQINILLQCLNYNAIIYYFIHYTDDGNEQIPPGFEEETIKTTTTTSLEEVKPKEEEPKEEEPKEEKPKEEEEVVYNSHTTLIYFYVVFI